MSMFVGEALAGEGNEIAHIDLLIGDKNGPVGRRVRQCPGPQSEGHTNLLAVLTPNLAVKPATVMITKVTIKGMKQAVQMFGPAQAAVAKAVADSVADKVIPADQAENLVIVCGVFIHPAAEVGQEDLRIQLRSHEDGHQERHERQADRRRRCSPARTRPPIRSAASKGPSRPPSNPQPAVPPPLGAERPVLPPLSRTAIQP